MPDRNLRLLTLPQQSVQPGGRSAVLLRERPSSPPDAASDRKNGGEQGGAPQEDNPFAPPAEGTPDRPWQPRHPSGDDSQGSQGGGGRSPWGGQWSDRQPGRSPGNFGERPGGSGPEGPGGGGGPRWDPTDPAQRRARYALLSGMWALFFALFTWPYVALLLGALALYWGISALRAKPRAATDPDTPAPPAAQTGRPQRTAAISGLVTSSLAIVLVAASFGAQLVYNDYYTCQKDALTNEAKQSCDRLLPEQLRDLLGTEG
ncbi:hypothetical protein [Streptomyces lancefieldiae]|uniref:Integral membrane protein n=1 Tax=Streptomyces lancefieldiae TaxID=3075520 RepID=A0ABU3AKE1_9ACTN|nr:hypothetical protein [Streptomyces sp. DSM 40712]MDT0610265.1 hypothetical protein [Streptomyces sp. DSM 40712]